MAATARPKARNLVTITAAAERAVCAERTIRRYIAAGRLTGYRMGPRMIRVDLDEVDALLTPIPAAGNGASAAR